MATKEEVIEVLKTVNDPEIMMDIWTLGLIYDVNVTGDDVNIKMTFTSPTCPYGPMLLEDIKCSVLEKTKAKEVNIDVTFDPPWEPSKELRSMLGV